MARIVSIAPARWITKDGRTLLPSDFDDAHLYNTVRKIRRDDWRREWLIFLESEMMRRGLRKELKILKITYPIDTNENSTNTQNTKETSEIIPQEKSKSS